MRYLGFFVILIGVGMILISFLVLNAPLEGSTSTENVLFRPGLTLGGMVTVMGILLTVALAFLQRQRKDGN